MAPEGVEPVTSKQAAKRLGRAPGTIRYWVTHYSARRLGTVGQVMYYDFGDLSVIERETRHGHPVPKTWQERAEIGGRCPLRAAEIEAAHQHAA